MCRGGPGRSPACHAWELALQAAPRCAALRCGLPQVLERLSEAFTEPLQAYQAGGGPSRAGEWDAKGAAWLGPFN